MFDRIAGLARSIAIYHAIPFRQRRLRQLYRHFVSPGDLVIDVGAHAGNHVRALAALGCRIVAVEPQPDFARVLRLLFGRSPHVTILETAVSDRAGRAELSISERTPTVTSLAADWRDARTADADFAQVRWNRRVETPVTTLDALAAQYGAPSFIKLDIEGSEPAALAGLSHSVPALAFEYLPRALDRVDACVDRLRALDHYVYNWSPGESYRLATAAWLEGPQLLDALRGRDAQRRSGDVYARRKIDMAGGQSRGAGGEMRKPA
jgi:FkbM family methyltransferase